MRKIEEYLYIFPPFSSSSFSDSDKYRGRKEKKHERRIEAGEKKATTRNIFIYRKVKKKTEIGDAWMERQADLLASGYRPRLTCIARALVRLYHTFSKVFFSSLFKKRRRKRFLA